MDIVIHVRPDICAAHGRDPQATKLIDLAKTFGTVESLDNALAKERSEHQLVVNNLTAQYDAAIAEKDAKIKKIEEYEVTPAELVVLKAIREKSAAEAAEFKTEITTRDNQLKAIQLENENRAAAIKAMYGF